MKEIDLAEPGASTIRDVVACPGTDTCKLGISSSRALAAELRRSLTETGADTCDATWWNTYLSWLDTSGVSYLAWVWNTWGASCTTLSLINDYAGTPTQMGQIYKTHLGGLP